MDKSVLLICFLAGLLLIGHELEKHEVTDLDVEELFRR